MAHNKALQRQRRDLNEKESEEQRESILKVFRERIQKNQEQVTGMEKECSDQNPGISHRVKRRRTRAERDRLHSGSTNTVAESCRNPDVTKGTSIDLLNMKDVKNVQGSKKISSEKKAFDRALKKGAYANQAKSCDNIPSAITTNRLTMRLGIFNRGKASDKIQREPVVFPRGVKEKAEQDIRRVLNLSDASLSQNSGGEYHIPHLGGGDGQFTHPLSDKGSYSFTRSPDEEDIAISPVPVIQTRPPKKSPVNLPESPDLKAIAKKLISVIKPRTNFPGRRFFEETRENLRLLYKQNAPTSHSSPSELLRLQLEATPSGQTEHSQRSSSVKSRHPEEGESCQPETLRLAAEGRMGRPSTEDAAPQEMDIQSPLAEKAEPKCHRNPAVASTLSHSPTLSEHLAAGLPMDAKDMFECNEKAMALLAEKAIAAEKSQPMEAETAGPSTNDLPRDGFLWDRSMGYGTDYGASRPRFNSYEQCGTRTVGKVRAKEHMQGIRNAYSALSARSVGHDHTYLPVTHPDQRPVLFEPPGVGSASVITEYNYKDVEMMPPNLTHMQYPNLSQGPMAFDLLDILDYDPSQTLQPDLRYVSQPTLRTAQPLGLHLETQSDDSPCWVPRAMVPHKPPGESPASPPRLYPQRLY